MIRYLRQKSKNMHINGHRLTSMQMPLNHVHVRIAENGYSKFTFLSLTKVHLGPVGNAHT